MIRLVCALAPVALALILWFSSFSIVFTTMLNDTSNGVGVSRALSCEGRL